LRWSDPEPDDPSTPLDWRIPALILATLFLNFGFWFERGLDLALPGPLARSAGALAVASFLITVLFFLAPALAIQSSKRSLFGAIENSIGAFPTLFVRFCAVFFLASWIAGLIFVPARSLGFIFGRDVSSTNSPLVAGAILLFLILTALQAPRANASLARFTNKLAVAVLIAALLRARAGWPALLSGFPTRGARSPIIDFQYGLSELTFYAAPPVLLAAGLTGRTQERKHVARIAAFGLAVCLFASLLVVAGIDTATLASPLYRPSLSPTVAVALWSGVRESYVPALMMITAISKFGAARFGIRVLVDCLATPWLARPCRWAFYFALFAAVVGQSLRYERMFPALFALSTTWIAVTAAVLTADFLAARWRVRTSPGIDYIGAIALIIGGTAPSYLGKSADQWWHPWLLPSYGAAFLTCLSGRALHRLLCDYSLKIRTTRA
jgi:hypothetical protein